MTDGPFANMRNPIGPGFTLTDSCIRRNVNDELSLWSAQASVDDCMVYDKYEDVAPCFYMVPHRGGHGGVGGTVGNPFLLPEKSGSEIIC